MTLLSATDSCYSEVVLIFSNEVQFQPWLKRTENLTMYFYLRKFFRIQNQVNKAHDVFFLI